MLAQRSQTYLQLVCSMLFAQSEPVRWPMCLTLTPTPTLTLTLTLTPYPYRGRPYSAISSDNSKWLPLFHAP